MKGLWIKEETGIDIVLPSPGYSTIISSIVFAMGQESLDVLYGKRAVDVAVCLLDVLRQFDYLFLMRNDWYHLIVFLHIVRRFLEVILIDLIEVRSSFLYPYSVLEKQL